MPLVYPSRTCECCGYEISAESISQAYYHYCDDCGYRCFDCGQCSCWCHDDDDDYRDNRVHEYDYRPYHWNPKGEFPMRPLMGMELEVHNRNIGHIPDVVAEFDASESHLFVKEDGSLTSGLEIVSHPATLEWTRAYPWSDLLTQLERAGCSSPNGYGLHVHVSRNAFRRQGKRSPTHQLTWLLFLHRNPRQLERLARRSSEQWAKFRKPLPGELSAKAHAHDGYGGDRYVAVNCQNQRTYELRFFASTLDVTQFMAAVEFADASVEYTRAVKTSDILRGEALSWPHFARWAGDHDYPNLAYEIEEQETLSVTTPREDVVNSPRDTYDPFDAPFAPSDSGDLAPVHGCTCRTCERALNRRIDRGY